MSCSQAFRSAAAVAALCAALALAPGAAQAASPQTVSASEAAVTATLSYRGSAEPGTGPVSGLRLTIVRAGAKIYDAPVSSHHCTPCGLESFGGGPLLVRDLEGNGEPSVIVELNSGGAHCCTIAEVLSYDPGTMSYRVSERDFGDPGAIVTDVAGDGSLEFETADDRFAYAFAPFAYSGLPLQVLVFRGGRFRDVTRSFPAALAKDAAKWLAAFRSERRLQLGDGLIAAWAADEELLGHDRLVRSTLAREARNRRLRSRESYGPSNASFVRALLRFLQKTGYRR